MSYCTLVYTKSQLPIINCYNVFMLKNNLSKLMGEKKLKISELHKLTGLSRNTLTKLYYERTDYISFKTIEKLCCILECNTQELLEYIPNENSKTSC